MDCTTTQNTGKILRSFSPERWLTRESEGPQNKLKGRYHPFGGGPRQCVGQAFAEEEYFSMFSNIVYHFKVESTDGKPLSEMCEIGIVLPTQRVPVRFQLRD
eukprot:TRINITY_DN184_c0_g1_i2.p1 TRINITY_DN184_c0_g1~~TRINITY_DN184_c0_g1_i2.p1  ORF type:complete len:102 (+),score=13.82 TRINITY_DN184_c0_g1_i2:424-729(+)